MSAPSRDDDLRKRTGRALFEYAFLRLESALTIVGTALLAFFLPQPFPWWRWWMWVALGAVFEALIIYTSVVDEGTGRKVVDDLLRERFRVGDIKTRTYRDKLAQAIEYREQIGKVIAGLPTGVLRDHLDEDARGVAHWIGYIYQVALRLDVYERDSVLQRDGAAVPASIQELERSLRAEDDAAVREQIQATLAAKRDQLANLHALQNRMQEAAQRLEQTVTALGVVYSQYQLLAARKLGDARAERLSDDIREQVARLEDVLSSMDEVYDLESAGEPPAGR